MIVVKCKQLCGGRGTHSHAALSAVTDRAVLAARISAPGCPICLAGPNGSAARADRLRREPEDEVEPPLHPAGERIISGVAFVAHAGEGAERRRQQAIIGGSRRFRAGDRTGAGWVDAAPACRHGAGAGSDDTAWILAAWRSQLLLAKAFITATGNPEPLPVSRPGCC